MEEFDLPVAIILGPTSSSSEQGIKSLTTPVMVIQAPPPILIRLPRASPAVARPSFCRMVSLITASLRVSLAARSEEHTSELQSRENLVCRLLLEKKNEDQLILTRE